MNNAQLRKNTLETLALLVERYPNLRIAQILGNAMPAKHDLYYVPDEELAQALNQLFIYYTQFEAAGIKP
jgi:hypothetical protein